MVMGRRTSRRMVGREETKTQTVTDTQTQTAMMTTSSPLGKKMPENDTMFVVPAAAPICSIASVCCKSQAVYIHVATTGEMLSMSSSLRRDPSHGCVGMCCVSLLHPVSGAVANQPDSPRILSPSSLNYARSVVLAAAAVRRAAPRKINARPSREKQPTDPVLKHHSADCGSCLPNPV